MTAIQQVCSQSSWSREDLDIHAVENRNLQAGYLDYKEKIKKTMDSLDFINDPEATDKMEELKAMDIACDAVIILGERYHKLSTGNGRERSRSVT